MKITGVYVQDFGGTRDYNLAGLSTGFNLIFGGNRSTGTAFAEFLCDQFYGCSKASVNPTGGFVDAIENENFFRITRSTRPSSFADRWDVNQRRPAVLPDPLQLVERKQLDRIFCFDDTSVNEETDRLASFIASQNLTVVPSFDEVTNSTKRLNELKNEIQQLDLAISNRHREREIARSYNAEQNLKTRNQLETLERAVDSIRKQLTECDPASIQQRIEIIDEEIRELRNLIDFESNRKENRRPARNSLAIQLEWLYRRLDEIDDQLRRWFDFQAAIQHDRVNLRDEMVQWNSLTVDSAQHPYHRSQELIRDIESQIVSLSQKISAIQPASDCEHFTQAISLSSSASGHIRGQLNQLCDELATQFKTVRHHAATQELRRLRRFFDEAQRNISELHDQRSKLLYEIEQFDPAGFKFIADANGEFLQLARASGHYTARVDFCGPIDNQVHETPVFDWEQQRTDLHRKQRERIELVRELVRIENRQSELNADLARTIAERDQLSLVELPDQNKLARIDDEIHQYQRRRDELVEQRNQIENFVPVEDRFDASDANQLVRRLTFGKIQSVRIACEHPPAIFVDDRSGATQNLKQLPLNLQQQVSLAVRLATAKELADQNHVNMPVILQDIFLRLDDQHLNDTVDLLNLIGTTGIQILAVTANVDVKELCRKKSIPVFDLPDTVVNPIEPVWNPERSNFPPPREPEFLTPFTTRPALSTESPLSYPQVKYPAATRDLDFESENFTPNVSTERGDRWNHSAELQTEHWFSDDTRLAEIGFTDKEIIDLLASSGVVTVGELLEIAPNQVPDHLHQRGFDSSDIDYWQSLVWLMVCVPGLRTEDSEILISIGICEPEQLENTHYQQLADRITRYLNSADGRRFSHSIHLYNRNRINSWYEALNRTRPRWRLPSGYSRRNRWNRTAIEKPAHADNHSRLYAAIQPRKTRPQLQRDGSNHGPAVDRNPDFSVRSVENRSSDEDQNRSKIGQSFDRIRGNRNQSIPTKRTGKRTADNPASRYKFYLNLNDDLDAAPSIGPKTAERFAKIGVSTVAEFLQQTAESMASKLNYKRFNANVVRQWQQQARLVCRVPNLRGHDAQLLVAVGITEAEDLSTQNPRQLFDTVAPFANSKEGLKIIRNGKQPDLEEVTNWIEWAQQTRSLQAA